MHDIIQKLMRRWFPTWTKPEYREWASKVPTGYLLLVIRQEKHSYLCAKAKLLMSDQGLPNFQLVEQRRFPDRKKALEQIRLWR